jgi:UDP-N-acetyl-D-glucosamine dehydrogenase
MNQPAPVISPLLASRLARLAEGSAVVGVIGLGYVGLPLVRAARRRGLPVIGFDLDGEKVAKLNAGRSYIRHISDADIARLQENGGFNATTDFSRLTEADIILICVPTPLTRHREPDTTYVVASGEAVARRLRRGQLVVLESTTYPGTTTGLLRPILERSGLRSGEDFFLAFSPEREDPGNADYETETIPKVVGADDPDALTLAQAFYGRIVRQVVTASSSAAAEAVKLTENIFRSVNIALVNELKLVYERMGVDIWEVIETAKTKPFGFMPFYPGPGLGGHCIPIDPFYLTWKAREYDVVTRFIELAGEINTAMPLHVVRRLSEVLDQRFRIGLNGAKILISGVAYKKNVDDMRESPALYIMDLLLARGATVFFHDPFIPVITPTREHPDLTGMTSTALTPETLATVNAALICADHDDVDYDLVAAHCPLVVDTRNAMRHIADRRNVVKA